MRTLAIVSVIAALGAAACGPGSGPTQAGGDNAPDDVLKVRALAAAPFSENVTTHGATPAKDNINERAFINAAIAAACAKPIGEREVYFPAGDYTVARPFEPGVKSSLVASCTGLTIRGDGMGTTTIAQFGTGMLPTNPNEPGTWKLLSVTGGSVSVRDLSFEGGLRTVDTEEQTHLVEVSESEDALLENLILKIPQRTFPLGAIPCLAAPNGTLCETPHHGGQQRLCHAPVPQTVPPITDALKGAVCTVADGVWTLEGWWGGGDCVRAFGDPGIARRARVRNVLAIDCDRSGFGGQRNIDDLSVENSTFCGEAPWDIEVTGGGGMKGVTARGVSLCGGRSNYAATNGGSGAGGLTSVDFDCQGGVLTGGGVSALDADVVTYSNCTIDSGLVAEASTIDVRKRANRVTFRKSTIIRPAGAPTAAVVNITHHTGVAPTLVTFEDVVMVQNTVAPFIDAKSISMLQLQRVKMQYLAEPWLKPQPCPAPPLPCPPPPANHTEAAAIIADTVAASPQSVGSVVLIDVKLEGPPGAFAELLRQAQADAWANPRRVVMANVDVRGVLRNAVLYAKGSAVTPAVTFDAASIKHDAPALCMGADCP